MALHPDFPHNPHAILDPEIRWFPADEILRDTSMDKLMPPLVAQLRRKVKDFRDISNYYSDFIVKLRGGRIVIVETKGKEDVDVPPKIARLKQWCEDLNRIQSRIVYDFVFVDDEGFEKYHPKTFREVLDGFKKYKVP